MRVRCYWNLHKRCWSIQDARTRRVIGHASRVRLMGVTFTVSQAGRERVLREGKKNVHAFACGKLIAAEWLRDSVLGCWEWLNIDGASARDLTAKGKPVTYNPRRDTSFVLADEARTPITEAKRAYLGNGITGTGALRRPVLFAT